MRGRCSELFYTYFFTAGLRECIVYLSRYGIHKNSMNEGKTRKKKNFIERRRRDFSRDEGMLLILLNIDIYLIL